MKSDNPQRCWWCQDDPLYINYHDQEWGIPLHDDQRLFEMLILEGFQAGLSWITVLRKRENFRKAFHQFNAEKIVRYTAKDVERLMQNPGIIRNQLKIKAAITNARCYLDIQDQLGSFDHYLWQFTDHQTICNPRGVTRKTMPTTSKEAAAMSKDLKKRGFKFVGDTVCYAHMQATGMVDDHIRECFKYHAN